VKFQVLLIKKNNFSKRVQTYFYDKWNVIDFAGCILFFIGFTLKALASFFGESWFRWAR
jgi:hypothetical protein